MSLTCAHCGLPVRNKKISLNSESGKLYFCCHGCRLSYQMLASPGETREDILESEIDTFALPAKKDLPGDIEEWEFSVDGMVCQACVPIVNKVLERTGGVSSSRVNFLTGRARIEYSPHTISKAKIKKRLSRYGYNAREKGESAESARADVLIRVSLGLFLAMDVMLLSVPEYVGAFGPGEEQWILYLRLAMLALTAPIMLWVARPIFLQAWASLVTFHPDINLLVGLGALSAFFYSIYGIVTGGPHVYFETAAFLPVMITVGKSYEEQAKIKAREALLGLVDVLPKKAVLIKDGDEVETPPETLRPGDRIVVKEGERVPVDADVVEGELVLDESMLTGESVPATKMKGSPARAGAEALSGQAVLEVRVPLEESLLALVVSSLERAELFRGGRQEALDRVVTVLTPLVIVAGIAAGAVVAVAGGGAEEAVLRAMTVVLFACPCALSLAAPLARAVAIGQAAQRGIAVKDGEALETGRGPTTLVIDKTGTLTRGKMTLARMWAGEGVDEDSALAVAASLDSGSSHPIASALKAAAAGKSLEMPTVDDVKETAGMGRTGVAGDIEYMIGSARFIEQEGGTVGDEVSEAIKEMTGGGMSVAVLAGKKGGWQAVAVFGMSDTVRPEAPKVINSLRESGIKPVLATGDNADAARSVAETCGIEEVHAGLSPDEKRDLVVSMKSKGEVVWTVGDGVNDAPALAASDLGIAMGEGARLASESAHLTLAEGGLVNIEYAVSLCSRVSTKVRQNLIWALLYNGIGLPLAFAGVLRPVFSAAAMMISSLSVVINSLRLRDKQEEENRKGGGL